MRGGCSLSTVWDLYCRGMKASRRPLLIRSGMDLFSRYGYRDVSVNDIVEGCGLSVGTFYKYFRSKEEYYEQILSLIEREGIRKANTILSRLYSPFNKLRAVFKFILLGVRRYPILRGVLMKDSRYMYPGIDLTGGSIGALRRHIEDALGQILREGSRRGSFRTTRFHDAQAMVTSMLDTLILSLDSPHVDKLADDLLVLVERGLRRAIRLRRRAERLDRRSSVGEEDIDWLDDSQVDNS